jgi:hypothetical protein
VAVELWLSASDQVRPKLGFVAHQFLQLGIAVFEARFQLLDTLGHRFADFLPSLSELDFEWHTALRRMLFGLPNRSLDYLECQRSLDVAAQSAG